MKKLYKFEWDCRRMGEVTGIFVEDDAEVSKHIGKDVYFGEILGKHSEVYGVVEETDITVLTEDQEFIKKFEELVGTVGYNPFEYIRNGE